MIAESKADGRPALAVLGAGGFVGTRLLQLNAVSRQFKVVPVLRSFRGLARLGAAVPDVCVTDTKDPKALIRAFQGSQTVLNLTMGDQLRIVDDTQVAYQACVAAGVRQFIHMSTSVVFGRVTDPGIHDDSPPDTRSWMLYARGKARAELWLRQQIGKNELQLVVLRPGLVWGPGSNWSEMVGDQLLHGTAVLSNGGKGIANLIFVDNLVRIILAVASRLNGPSGFYNVADNETVTWQEYYGGLAARLGYSSDSVCLWPDGRLRVGPKQAVEWALEQPGLFKLAKCILKHVGPGTKALIRTRLKGSPEPPGGRGASTGPPVLARAHWALQNTLHQLPTTKVHRDFGPLELIGFDEGLDTTATWLKFAGFAAPAHVRGPFHALPQE